MATMFPSRAPAVDGPGKRAERMVYERLREALDDDFRVFYDVSYVEPERAGEGQIDFLVAHPTRGLLFLECKGDGVHRDGNGDWYRMESSGTRTYLDESPFEQVRRHQREFVDRTQRQADRLCPGRTGTYPLVYGHAVIFPRTKEEQLGHLPPDAPDPVLLTADDLENLDDPVERAMAFHRRRVDDGERTLDSEAFERLVEEVISPELNLAATIGGTIEMERQRLVELTDDQKRVVEGLFGNDRVAVRGPAGSGKTILALHAARSMAREGRRVLLVCFTRRLAEDLRERVADMPELPGEIVARHFHGLAREAAERIGADLDFPPREAPEDERRAFWEEEMPLHLAQAFRTGEVEPWSALVVDEAQDFHGLWWEALVEGLVESGGDEAEPAGSKLFTFFDRSQDLFDRGGALPDFETTFDLKENLRNTEAIARFVDRFGDTEMEVPRRAPAGEEPVVRTQSGPRSALGQIEAIVANLCKDEAVSARQIAVVTPHSRPNSSLAGADEVAGIPLTDDPSERDGAVLHGSIGALKGLESDVVILADVDPDDPRCSENALYVACSRARHRLYVLTTDRSILQS
ncbi:MAG: NERD domain-containing protein [Bradymonadaceae bacterium]